MSLDAFCDRLSAFDPHSLLILQDGRTLAECYWHPYDADGVQLLYSLSKSFTAAAIGLAIDENRFGLDDFIADLLPGRRRYGLGDGMDAVRVRHLLSMASGHEVDTIGVMLASDDPVGAVLAQPLCAEPGTLFTYNQGCTYLLSAAIREHTGEQLHEYLRPRLFDPLGIGVVHWRQLAGLDQGFSGLHTRTRDIAALGQTYLSGGRFGESQVLPEWFVSQAQQAQVSNADRGETVDWQQGYGFQLWRCQHDCFRGDGAFGQFMIMVPALRRVVAITSQTESMQAVIDLVWEHLLDPDLADEAPVRLSVQPPPAVASSGAATRFAVAESTPFLPVRAIEVQPTSAGSTPVRVVFDDGDLDLRVTPDWALQTWRETLDGRKARTLPDVQVAGGWVNDTEFVFDVIFIRSPHRLSVRCSGSHAHLDWWTVPL